METKTLLIDPESFTTQRAVFKIPAGLKFKSKKVRVLNTGLSNVYGSGVYFLRRGRMSEKKDFFKILEKWE